MASKLSGFAFLGSDIVVLDQLLDKVGLGFPQ
jgi:hypothetical protein